MSLPIRLTAPVSRLASFSAKAMLAAAVLLLGASTAHAATQTAFVVTNATDTAATGVAAHCQTATLTATSCGLRDALAAAAAVATSTTPATITFSATYFPAATTITEQYSILTLPSYTTLTGLTTGSGASLTNLITVSGNNQSAVIQTLPGSLGMKLSNLIITKGSAGTGGGVYNQGTLTIAQSTIIGNTSGSIAGGIFNYAGGNLTITQSTISGNTASTQGGGIYNAGTLTISASTISGNIASAAGGGISSASGTVSLTHVTISANKTVTTAGGLYVGLGTVTVTSSVIAGNSTTGSYADVNGAVTAVTSVVNISSAATTPLAYQPSLSALGNYGGPTQTMPVLPTPIANDTIAFCYVSSASAGTAYTDQRGVAGWTNYNGTYCSDAGATESSFAVSYVTQPALSYVVNALTGSTTSPVIQITDDTLAYAVGGGSFVFTDTGSVIAGTTTVPVSGTTATLSAASFKAVYGADQLVGTYTLTLPTNSTAPLAATSTPFNVTATTTIGLTISSPITYGTTLAGLTPTATFNGSSIPGVFTYTATPSGGAAVTVGTTTVLPAGTYVIVATFIPTNAVLYSGGTATAALLVTKATPIITLTEAVPSIFIQNTDNLTASAPAVGAGIFPTGNVSFYTSGSSFATIALTPVGSTSNTAVDPYIPTASGVESITAVYAGDNNYNPATSNAVTLTPVDINFTATPQFIATTPGSTVTSAISVTPIGATTFPYAITLSQVMINPTGPTSSLSTSTVAKGATSGSSTLTIVIPSYFVKLEQRHGIDPRVNGYAPIAFAFLMLPFAVRLRKAGKRFKSLALVLVLSLMAAAGLSGCSGQRNATLSTDIVPVQVTATAGALSYTITVTAQVAYK
jgi:hypothetical protein